MNNEFMKLHGYVWDGKKWVKKTILEELFNIKESE